MKQKNIFFSSAVDEHDDYSFALKIVKKALSQLIVTESFEIELIEAGNLIADSFLEEVSLQIGQADLVITHISKANFNGIYGLGVANALNKANILLIDDESESLLSYGINNYKFITYNIQAMRKSDEAELNLSINLAGLIKKALQDPSAWKLGSGKEESAKKLKSVFISYSHKDVKYLERLQIHLRPLERKSLIQLWSDTLIKSGEKWKKEIENALNKSSIAIILISADFLASEFIINNELQPLLKTAEEKGTIIIPIVLKPCRFVREQSISQFQAANDPALPLCNMTEYEQEIIYERIASRIELVIESVG